MKKPLWMGLLAAMLALLLCAPGLAETTGVAVDGKIYVFSGTQGSYVAGGKTFIIGEDSVTIRQSGMPDRVLPLVPMAGDVAAEEPRRAAGSSLTAAEEAGDRAGEVWDAGMIEEAGEQAGEILDQGTAKEDASSAFIPGTTLGGQAQESGAEPSCAEKAALFSAYAAVDITYDAASDRLYYQGRPVRRFADIRQPMGEGADGSVTVSALYINADEGEVDVEIIRDFTAPDARGDGALAGLIVTPVE